MAALLKLVHGSPNLGKSALNPNLKKLGVEYYITSAEDLGRTLVATVDTESVKSKDQDEKNVPEHQKQLIFLNLNGVEPSTNAQNAQVE